MIEIILFREKKSYSIHMKVLTIFLLVFSLSTLSFDAAYGCNVCHSKNPKMVLMHKELGFKDCFRCHGQDLKKNPEERKTQMVSDGRCVPCHKK